MCGRRLGALVAALYGWVMAADRLQFFSFSRTVGRMVDLREWFGYRTRDDNRIIWTDFAGG